MIEQQGELIRQNQSAARAAGDQLALAHWSRLRWQWLVANGKAEVK